MLNVILLNVANNTFMLSVVMLNVVMQNVMALFLKARWIRTLKLKKSIVLTTELPTMTLVSSCLKVVSSPFISDIKCLKSWILWPSKLLS